MRAWHRFGLALLVIVPLACEGGCNPNVPGPAPSTLRRLHVTTAGGAPVLNTDDYVAATMWVVAPDGTEEVRMATQLRGRGNSTWALPKKPYRLRLSQSAALAGMPADRDWALLANYTDETLVRNRLAMELGEAVGLAYNPRSEFVELYLNGRYEGVYELYQHLEVGPDKVDVEELDPDADVGDDVITGGYFLEVDHGLDEDVCWTTTSGDVPICSKDPEFDPTEITNPNHPSAAQYTYITGYVDDAEAAIATPGDAYEQFFDVEAMVGWFLVSELMENKDSRIVGGERGPDRYTSSVFLHKDRGGPLVLGPLWDFDLSAGNDFDGFDPDATGWWIRESDWFAPLFAHSSFGGRVFSAWCELRADGTLAGLSARVDSIVAEIGPVAINGNFEKWPVLGSASYADGVEDLKDWLTARADWMHAEFVAEFGECAA